MMRTVRALHKMLLLEDEIRVRKVYKRIAFTTLLNRRDERVSATATATVAEPRRR